MRLPRALILLAALAVPAGMRAASAQFVTFDVVAGAGDMTAGGPVMLAWRLHNLSDHPVIVLAGMESPGRLDFDPVTLDLRTASGDHRIIALMGKRSAVQPVLRTLRPGERLEQPFNLTEFAAMNGVNLTPGAITLRAVYQFRDKDLVPAAQQPMAMTDRLSAPPLRIILRPPP